MIRIPQQQKILKNGRGRYSERNRNDNKYIVSVTDDTMDSLDQGKELFKVTQKERLGIYYDYCNKLVSSALQHRIILPHFGVDISRVGKIGYVKMNSLCRMNTTTAQNSKKLYIRQKGVIQNLLRNRNLNKWGLSDCDVVYFQDDKGYMICIWVINVLSFDESLTLLAFKEDYIKHPEFWSKGCEATLIPNADRIKHDFKHKLYSGNQGLNPQHHQVHSMGPQSDTGLTNNYTYQDDRKPGKVNTRPLSSALPRKKHDETSLKSLCKANHGLSDTLKHIEDVYRSYLPEYFMSRGCNGVFIEEEVQKTMESLHYVVNYLSTKDKIGNHCDPPVRSPALVTGSTTFIPDKMNQKWNRDPNLKSGGNLYLADSMLSLDYHPQDLVMFDGNILHGVTDLCGTELQKLSRFSIVLFSRHDKDGKIKKYNTYDQSFHSKRKSKRARGLPPNEFV